MWIETAEWSAKEVQLPIPKPRDGKTYTWRWSAGITRAWVKDYFDLCYDCRKEHDPKLSHCPWCGKAVSDTTTHLRTNPVCREALA